MSFPDARVNRAAPGRVAGRRANLTEVVLMSLLFRRARLFGRVLVAVLLGGFAIASSYAAAPYSSLYVFGDSLTDSGNALAFTQASGGLVPDVPPPPYFDGRFSNGYNFADQLSQRLFGVPANAYLASGGNNFAVGGATTGRLNVVTAPFPGVPDSGMLAQLDIYQGLHPMADPNALYLVYGGSNDMIAMITTASSLPAVQAEQLEQATIAQAMDNLGVLIGGLSGADAGHFLVPNLADIGKTPRFVGDADVSSFASQTTVDFNAALSTLLGTLGAAPGMDIRTLDVFGAFNTALAGGYGFANTTGACYGGTIFGGTTDFCADPDSYLFWDDLHPTARTHQILGDLAYAVAVPEGQTWGVLLAGLGLLAACMRRRVAA
jgi:outer membrane lipase/esterase